MSYQESRQKFRRDMLAIAERAGQRAGVIRRQWFWLTAAVLLAQAVWTHLGGVKLRRRQLEFRQETLDAMNRALAAGDEINEEWE